MLITKTFHDIPSALDPNGRPIRIFVIAPTVPGYPNAKFPGEKLKAQSSLRCKYSLVYSQCYYY
jgi:hypothetical protein